MAQRVRDLMTTDPITCSADATVLDAARQMKEGDIGDVLVMDGDRLAGIITDRDVVVRGVADGRDPGTTRLRELCSEDLVSLRPDDDVQRAVQLMRERAIRRIPVVDGGRPVGILSIGDLAMELDRGSALSDISAATPDT
jgi:CBS domain-containing protein